MFFFLSSQLLTAQVRSMFGQLRYQHQVQDNLNDQTGYSRFSRLGPQLMLGINGFVLSSNLLDFQLMSSLQAYYTNAQGSGFETKGKQMQFTYYNATVNALPGYAVSGSIQAYDQELQSTTSDIRLLREGITGFRQRRETAILSLHNVASLPDTRFQYRGTRNRTEDDNTPYESRESEFEFDLAQSTKGSSLTMRGTVTRNFESLTGLDRRYSRFVANATKTLDEGHRLELYSEYYETAGTHSLSSTTTYTGALQKNLQLSMSGSGRNQQSAGTFSLSGSFSQSLAYSPDEHIQLLQTSGGATSRGTYDTEGGRTIERWHTLTGMLAATHSRQAKVVSFFNNLSGGITRQRTVDASLSQFASCGNTIDFALGRFMLSLGQASSFNALSGFDAHQEQVNSATATTSLELPFDIRISGIGNVQDERRMKTTVMPYRRRSFNASGQFSTTQDILIPISVSASAGLTINNLDSKNDLRTYTWSLLATSPSFIMRYLSVTYHINRSFDFVTERVLVFQSLEANYQWRSVSFQLRLLQFQLLDRRRELWFEVVRYF